MPMLQFVLSSQNLFVQNDPPKPDVWKCLCFGRCKPNGSISIENRPLEFVSVGNSETAITFEDRDAVLNSVDSPDWKKENPCGAIWLDFVVGPNQLNTQIQATVLVSSDTFEIIKHTDFSTKHIYLTLEFPKLVPRLSNSANGYLSSASVHFHSNIGKDGIFGPPLLS